MKDLHHQGTEPFKVLIEEFDLGVYDMKYTIDIQHLSE